ncbi:hypothetical protein CERSUDRAFT_120292 [Gelatoporia subvermispora B]|uniref:Uncharacterized protein n=1 Tax=Ceriporiopsis subvermispora (strain B) TaxID=914234 RepID=M2Q1Y8_CERS8|nr:hypothetical protein CERSUDRAFT_120292 [Gelatoporia subvermispora B]
MRSSSCTRTTPCQAFTTGVRSGGLGVPSAHNYLVTVTVRRWHSTVLYSCDLRPAAGHAKGSSHLSVFGERRGCAIALVTQRRQSRTFDHRNM